MAKAPLTPLVLHAVIGADHASTLPGVELQLVTFRDIAAVVQPVGGTPATAREALREPAHALAHHDVIAALHRQVAILPAPAGVVVRDGASVLRWLEVHHVALCEALTFVDDRCEARVHVTRTPACEASAASPPTAYTLLPHTVERSAKATIAAITTKRTVGMGTNQSLSV